MILHIHNGDSTADTLRAANFPGTHFAFREALTHGAAPCDLALTEWLDARAAALAGLNQQAQTEIRRDLQQQQETLARLDWYEEIVLWFEHDLFCQVHLVYLLTHLIVPAPTRLSLICIGAFPGLDDFRGLGQLTAAQLETLFPARQPVTVAQQQLATRIWQAYGAPDPHQLVALLHEDLSALPFIRAALLQHLGRFPSVQNGLSHAQSVLLELIAAGHTDYQQLCAAFFAAEPTYGLGDLAVQQDLRQLASGHAPALMLRGATKNKRWHKVTCELTPRGEQVRTGQADFIELNGIDQWLGGVHLTTKRHWRWDAAARNIKLSVVKS